VRGGGEGERGNLLGVDLGGLLIQGEVGAVGVGWGVVGFLKMQISSLLLRDMKTTTPPEEVEEKENEDEEIVDEEGEVVEEVVVEETNKPQISP